MEKKNQRKSKAAGKGKQRKADAVEDLELADEQAQRVKGGAYEAYSKIKISY